MELFKFEVLKDVILQKVGVEVWDALSELANAVRDTEDRLDALEAEPSGSDLRDEIEGLRGDVQSLEREMDNSG